MAKLLTKDEARRDVSMPCGRPTLTLLTRIVARDTGALQRMHLGAGLLEPEPHFHLMEQAHRRRQMHRGPRIAHSPEELAEAEVAASDERAHADLQGQSRGSGVVGFDRRYVRPVTM
jgi:hypothetical protein